MEQNADYPSEDDFNEVFGLTSEETGSEGAQERTEDEGAPGGEETHTEGTESTQEGSEGDPEGNPEGETEGEAEDGTMSPEERHRQAAARRAREDEARRQAAETAAQARVDQVYRDMFRGQTDPYTGRAINSEADYRAYEARRAEENRNAQLERAGVDPEGIRELVRQETAPMREQMEAARLGAMRQRAQAVNEAAEKQIAKAVKGFALQLPEAGIQTIEDVGKLPTGAHFNQLVQRGYTLEDAFYIANRDAISAQSAKAARAAAVNATANRQHLSPAGKSGGEIVDVPRAVTAMYRELMPEATDAEIRAAYAAELKH